MGINFEEVLATFPYEDEKELFGEMDDKMTNESFSLEVIHEEGGEGEGDYYEKVIRVTNNNTDESALFLHTANFSSWDGVDWSIGEFGEAEEKKVMVTQYHFKG